MNTLTRAASDPVYFGHAFLNWHAFPQQAEWLRESVKSQNWCRAGNRWGKTESIAIKHLWMCTFKRRDPFLYDFSAPYETVNTSLSLDQATLPLRKAWRFVQRQEAESYRKTFIKRMVQTPFPRIEFNHGAVWWARSTVHKGKYLEGKDFDYASNDEGAFDADLGYIVDEVLSLRLLDRNGQMDFISTGKRGSAFNRRYEAAKRNPDHFTFQGSTLDNPHIDHGALDRLVATVDKGLLEERIYGGERPSDGRIPYSSIMQAIKVHCGLSPRQSGRRYSTGWDLAKNRHFTVGVTLDITEQPYQLVAWEAFNAVTEQLTDDGSYWRLVYERIKRRHEIYGGLLQLDSTGMGTVAADHLTGLGGEAIHFTGQKLMELIGCLELAFGLGVIGIPHLEMTLPDDRTWTLVDELEEVSDQLTGLDTATALALALWGVRKELQGEFPYHLSSKVKGVKR